MRALSLATSMGPKAVTFDLDDTLAVVERSRPALLDDATAAVGAPSIDRADYLAAHARHGTGRTREPIFRALLADHGVDDVDPAELARAYRAAIGAHLRPVPGVEVMLDRLSEHLPVGLITNGPAVAQRDKLERLGWTDRFDAVVIAGRLGAAKPAPEPFEVAARRLDVEVEELLHVGDDRRADIDGARAVGAETIHVVEATTSRSRADRPVIERHQLSDRVGRLLRPAPS